MLAPGKARGPIDHRGLQMFQVTTQRVKTLDGNVQYLKQESCLTNISSCSTQPPTRFTEKVKCI